MLVLGMLSECGCCKNESECSIKHECESERREMEGWNGLERGMSTLPGSLRGLYGEVKSQSPRQTPCAIG